MQRHPQPYPKRTLALILGTLSSSIAIASGSAVLPDELSNITIHGTDYEAVTLVDGTWEGEPWVEGGASRPRVGLARDFLLSGDIDGDGNSESVVLVWQSSGGSGTFNFIALMDQENGGWRNVATTPIGDRVRVQGGNISQGRLELDVIEHDDDDPACCPTREATRIYDAQLKPLTESTGKTP